MLPKAASAVDSAAAVAVRGGQIDSFSARLEPPGSVTAAKERQIGEPGQIPRILDSVETAALSARACSSHARPSLAWP